MIHVVAKEEAGKRLDVWLKEKYPSFSRNYFQYLIEEGEVLVNGSIVKKKEVLCECDEVDLSFIELPAIKLVPEPIPVDILFEDEWILVVNKPVGMVVHPAPGHYTGTLVHALLYHCNLSFDQGSLRPGIVHRLDKDTSGVLIAAKDPKTLEKLTELFSKRLIEKTYLAICVGSPKEQRIDAPIGRNPKERKQMAIIPDGREAVTLCRPLSPTISGLTYVELKPITGRTHQLRVHMRHANTPILGDPVYGALQCNRKWGVSTQLLHAAKIAFTHPHTGSLVQIEAPQPSFFQTLSQRLMNSKKIFS